MTRLPLALLLALVPVTLLARTAPELPADAVVVTGELQNPADRALLDALRNSLSGGSDKAIAKASPAALERASLELLTELREVDPTPAQKRWVESLLGHEPVHWRQHPETLTPWFIPVWNLAAESKALLQQWQLREALIELLSPLRRDGSWSPALLGARADLQLMALQALSEGDRRRLLSLPIPAGLGSPAWQFILQSGPEAEVWTQALRQAPDDALRRSMLSVWAMPANEARALLARLRAERPELSSSAVMALRADPDPQLRLESLLRLLDEPLTYRAAAAVLAEEPALRDADLISRFLAASGAAQRRGLALALRLRDSAQTREFLAGWLAESAGDQALKESLR